MEQKMEDEYTVAVFEDDSKEIIPKAWIQDYLKDDVTTHHFVNHINQVNEIHHINHGNHVHSTPADQQPSNLNTTSETEENVYFETIPPDNTKNILENLVKQVAENRSILLRLEQAIHRLMCIATGEPEPQVNINQPADTLGDFLRIEEYIKVKCNYNEMVLSLGKIGGKTVESATRKIWSKLCTTRLATTICWTGANGKYSLKSLTLNNLVRDAVIITHPLGKECDIQRATMLWFSHAQDRFRSKQWRAKDNY